MDGEAGTAQRNKDVPGLAARQALAGALPSGIDPPLMVDNN